MEPMIIKLTNTVLTRKNACDIRNEVIVIILYAEYDASFT